MRTPEALRVFLSVTLVLPATGSFADSFVCFESGHVRPLALSPTGEHLFAVNTPDNRLEVFEATVDGLRHRGETVVGLEPVAVAVRTPGAVFVVNHLSDSVSVVDATDPSRPYVRATLLVGDEPRDVVVGGPDRDKVFVTTAHRGQNHPDDPELMTPGVGRADVWVFDAGDLSASPHVLTLFCDTPRALAVSPDGRRVYAAAFHSGNGTTILGPFSVTSDPNLNAVINDGFTGLGMAPPLASTAGVPAPETGLIVRFDGNRWLDSIGRDWTARVRFNLPDKDVFVIDATEDPPVEIGSVRHVGTVLFNMVVHPTTGALYVSNTEARNDVRFEPELSGNVAQSRITIVDGTAASPVHLNPHIDYSTPSGSPEEIARSLALPLDMVFSADGSTLYVAAFGSAKVGVLDAEAEVLQRIAVGGGPSGLALDEDRARLYVMNRFDHTISVVDTESRVETHVVPLRYDPEPAPIKDGRPLLYDASNSGHGDSACASCHVFGDFDSLAWDLGDPDGSVVDNPLVPVALQGNTPLRDFHPMKGPMTTQSLRGMAGAGPMHWRGDRNGVNSGAGTSVFDEDAAFMHFRPAFQSLLGMATELPESEMKKFRDFILAVQYPPNPLQNLDSSRTAEQQAGAQLFSSQETGDRCTDCHSLPLGTNAQGTSEGSEDFKVPHLRNMYQKIGMFGFALPGVSDGSPPRPEPTPTPHLGDQIRGFGYLHDGAIPDVASFLDLAFDFPSEPGRSRSQKVRELSSFLFAFPTGLAPVVGQQVTLDSESPPSAVARWELLRSQADSNRAELVVHGLVEGQSRGYFYLRREDLFQSDRRSEQLSHEDLLALARGGAVLTATAVYRDGGERVAIDRDEDGWLDGDELRWETDAADPSSVPEPFVRGNCNGDPRVDLSDAVFTLGALFLGDAAPACDDACDSNDDGVVNITDAIATLGVLFLGSGSIPPPGMTECGVDPTGDGLGCERPPATCP